MGKYVCVCICVHTYVHILIGCRTNTITRPTSESYTVSCLSISNRYLGANRSLVQSGQLKMIQVGGRTSGKTHKLTIHFNAELLFLRSPKWPPGDAVADEP